MNQPERGLLLLRVSLAITFVLFAIQKLKNPGQGTAEIQLLFPFLSQELSSLTNFASSVFEIAIAIALISGKYVRIAGLLGGLFIITIVISNIYWQGTNVSADMYRDIGLIGASLALCLFPTPRQ